MGLWGRTSTNSQREASLMGDLSNPKSVHTMGGSRWGGARRGGGAEQGGAGRDADECTQETTVPLALQGIEDNCPERFFGRAITLCKPNRGTQRAVDEQLATGLFAGPRALFVLGC